MTNPNIRAIEELTGRTTHSVFFATNRAGDYTSEFSNTLRFGFCNVSVPTTTRAIGSIKRVVIERPRNLEDRAFYESLSQQETPAILIFVHGFNVSFKDVISRAAQMKHDLKFGGAMLVFSWPSLGDLSLKAYISDQETLEASRDHFVQFLQTLVAAQSSAQQINLIVHSLGSRLVVNSLTYISAKLQGGRPLNHLVFAAPDIATHLFRQRASAVASTANSVTMYVSSNDSALQLAQQFFNSPRAGDCRVKDGVVVVPNVATVDVSALNTEFLGHGYISSNPDILSDLSRLLSGEAVPRFGMETFMHKCETCAGEYWRFMRQR